MELDINILLQALGNVIFVGIVFFAVLLSAGLALLSYTAKELIPVFVVRAHVVARRVKLFKNLRLVRTLAKSS